MFDVKNPEIEGKLRELGNQLNDSMPEGFGFALLMFDYTKRENPINQGAMFYISSAKREDMIKAMEEFLEKQKGVSA